MKKFNCKGFAGLAVLGVLAAGAIVGAFVCYVGHFPR